MVCTKEARILAEPGETAIRHGTTLLLQDRGGAGRRSEGTDTERYSSLATNNLKNSCHPRSTKQDHFTQ